jgi:4-amino-4-deoxy-L-arabinose transferase-like glycosyltransferase
MKNFFSSHPRPIALSLKAAVAIILIVTLWRIVLLWVNQTDLFVDEAQYWLWGQNPDFGYYSKPPMIGWIIRLSNMIGHSDSTFWVRLPAPLFHMATALLMIPLAARTIGRDAAPWAGVTFVTLPAVSLSSVLMSTDTIQLTFLTVAIMLFVRLTKGASALAAIGLGLSLGLAFMTKYSVLFLLPGVFIAMLTIRSARISWRDTGIAAVVGGIVVAPNLWWNVTHGAVTVRHTESIANWNVGTHKAHLDILDGPGFLAAQFGVVGPIVFAMILWAGWRMIRGRSGDREKLLVWLSLPCILLITVQAIFGDANANWGVPAYVAGTVLACGVMMILPWWVLRTSLVINAVVAVVIPLLTVFAYALKLPNGDLVMKRYVGRAAVSEFIAETAKKEKIGVIVAGDRGMLADLFYTLRGRPLTIYAKPRDGFPESYYEQTFSMPEAIGGPVLYASLAVATCEGVPAEVVGRWAVPYGYRRGQTVYVQKMTPNCLVPATQAVAMK